MVAKLFVQLGDKVHTGQELVKMDDSEARRGVASAQATLQSAEAGLASMLQGGSQEELNTGKSDMETARLQLQQATATLTSLQKLQARGAASASEVSSAQQRVADAQVHIDQLQTRHSSRYSSTDLATQRAIVAQARAGLDAARPPMEASTSARPSPAPSTPSRSRSMTTCKPVSRFSTSPT